MSEQTRAMVLDWLELHRGDREGLARWMRDSMHIGSLRACRALIEQAIA